MATFTWSGGTIWGGASSNVTWTGGTGQPGAGDTVVLGLASSTLTLGADEPASGVLAALTISSSTATLAIGAFTLSVGAGAVSVGAGALTLAGGTLSDTGANGVTLTSGTISGYGTISSLVKASGAAHITQSGGATLEITGVVTAASATLGVGATATDRLLLDASSSSVSSVSFASPTGSGTLEIGASGSLTVATALSVGSNTITLDNASGAAQFTATGGIGLAGGEIGGAGTIATASTIKGYGTVAINLATGTGAGAITASGGTLDLTGSVNQGSTTKRTLAIDSTVANSVLAIGGTAASNAITFTGSSMANSQTLRIDATGALTIGAAQTIENGAIVMNGGALSDSSGITLGASTYDGSISGFGKITANISKAGTGTTNTITASGGTLEISGTVGASATPINGLTVGAGASDTLRLDAASFATAATFSGSTGTLEIGAAGALTLTDALAIGANTLKLDNTSGAVQLTDGAGLTLAGGSILGTGTVAAATTISGWGTVAIPISGSEAISANVSAETLDLQGVLSGTPTLSIAAGATLQLDAADSATSAAFTGAGATLDVASGGSLTLTSALAVGAGVVELDGTGSQLSDANGVTLAGGSIEGTGTIGGVTAISGWGTVAIALTTGAGSITANGDGAGDTTLDLTGAVSGRTLAIGSANASDLKIDGVASAANAVAIGNAKQTLEIGAAGSLTLSAAESIINGAIQLDGGTLTDASGLTIGAGATLEGAGTIGSGTGIDGAGAIDANDSGGTLELKGALNGATSLSIGAASGLAATLLLDADDSATSATFTGTGGAIDLADGADLSLVTALAIGDDTVALDGAGDQLNDANGVSLGSGGLLEGEGLITSATSVSGTGAIDANVSGGTLTLAGALSGTTTLSIGAASGSAATLIVDGVDSAASAAFTGIGGALEIAAGGSLSLTNGLEIDTGDTLQLEGSGVQFNASSGVYLQGGAISGTGAVGSATEIGGYSGTVNVAVNGSTINLSYGGDLVFKNTVTNSSVSNQGGTTEFDANTTLDAVDFTNGVGLITVGAGAAFTVAGSVLTLFGAGIEGSGTVENTDIDLVGSISAGLEGGSVTVGGDPNLETNSNLSGTVDATAATSFYISSAPNEGNHAELEFSGTVGSATITPTITFDPYSGSTWGALDLDEEGTGATFASNFHAVIDGFTGTGGSFNKSDQILVEGSGVSGDMVVWTQNGSSGTLDVEGSGGNVLEALTLEGSYYQNQFSMDEIPNVYDQITYTACYARGTRVLTDRGDAAVEDLRIGDSAVTASGALRPIVWLGHRRIDILRHPDFAAVAPVRVLAGAFGEGLPRRDLWLSPGHNIAWEGALTPISALVNGVSVAQIARDRVEYWHVELDAHDVIFAEGLPAESYLDTGNRSAFENGGAFLEAHPDFKPKHWAETCLPLAHEGAPVARAKARLIARLFEQGCEVTRDAGAHVMVDGRRIEPTIIAERRLAFALPEGGRRIELRSNTFTPAHILPESADLRQLGLCVGRLQIDEETAAIEDETKFAAGWRSAEHVDGRFAHRWTSGATPLPTGARKVVVDLAFEGYYWRSAEAVAASAA